MLCPRETPWAGVVAFEKIHVVATGRRNGSVSVGVLALTALPELPELGPVLRTPLRGFLFARFGNLDLGTPSRNRANVAVAKDASRSGIMAFCRRRCRLFRELHHSRASIVLARLYNVRRGGNFGNSPKRTEGVASAGEHPPVAK